MSNRERILPIIEQIYDAALEPSLWLPCVEKISDAIGGTSGVLVLIDHKQLQPQISAGHRLLNENMEIYAEHFADKDIWRGKLVTFPSGTIATNDELVSAERFLASEHFNDFLDPQDIFHICCFDIVREPSHFGFLSVFRPRQSENFDTIDMATMRVFAPHIQAATQIAVRLSDAASTTAMMGDALMVLIQGVVLVDREARILFANAEARRICDSKDGLRDDRGYLAAQHSLDTTALRRAIFHAAATSLHGSGNAGRALSLPRLSGERPLELLIAPLPASVRGCLPPRASAIVFVSDPENEPRLPEDSLRTLYGLTPAEARFAVAFVEETSIKAASERLAITEGTARTYLKRVFSKTDVNSQAALMKLILTGLTTLSSPRR